MRLILWSVLFKTTVLAQLHAEPIGDITNLRGYGQVLRDLPYEAILDFDINSYDDVQTRNFSLLTLMKVLIPKILEYHVYAKQINKVSVWKSSR